MAESATACQPRRVRSGDDGATSFLTRLWPHWPELLAGLWVTVQLTVLATIGGLAIGILGAAIRSGRPGMLSRVWGGYVEIIRNTPFVVQLFFIVFGLPNLGLKMTAGEAALLAMMVNLGAYSTEIVRAGIQVTPKGPVGSRPRARGLAGRKPSFASYCPGAAADLSGAGQPVHHCDARLVSGVAGLPMRS